MHNVHELLTVLEQPTAEMQALRVLLTEDGRYPARRTWERRLHDLPASLPAQIGCLGRYLVALIQPWATGAGRAAAIDSSPLRARGGSDKDRDQRLDPLGRLAHPSQYGGQ